jgi:FixJ family two-component response regulator
MPDGLTGRQLAEILLAESPDLPVIYTSGYSTEVAGGDLVLREGVNFLAKPYVPATLVETVRHRLSSISTDTTPIWPPPSGPSESGNGSREFPQTVPASNIRL